METNQQEECDKMEIFNRAIVNTIKELPPQSLKTHIKMAQELMDEMGIDLLDYYVIPKKDRPYIIQRKNAKKEKRTAGHYST